MVIYSKDKQLKENKPLIYQRTDERFDLFSGDVFGFKIDFSIENVSKRHDFIAKNQLIIYILSKEDIILLKSITNREIDLEDIETIVKTEDNINWDYVIEKAISQKKISPGY